MRNTWAISSSDCVQYLCLLTLPCSLPALLTLSCSKAPLNCFRREEQGKELNNWVFQDGEVDALPEAQPASGTICKSAAYCAFWQGAVQHCLWRVHMKVAVWILSPGWNPVPSSPFLPTPSLIYVFIGSIFFFRLAKVESAIQGNPVSTVFVYAMLVCPVLSLIQVHRHYLP